MNVLLFTIDYPPTHGGVANYYGNLVKYWPDKDKIFVLNNNEELLINRRLPALKWLPSVWRLWQNVIKFKVDRLLVGQILPLGYAAYIIKKVSRVKYSVFLHGMDFTYSLKNKRKAALAVKILNDTQFIFCVNSYVSGLVKQFLPSNQHYKIKLVNPGVERFHDSGLRMPDLKEKYNLRNKIVLLSAGRLVKRKGFDNVLDSLPLILKQVPNLLYVILGDGPEIESFKLKIKNLKLDNTIILGSVSEQEKQAWYNACDIFIMVSRNIDGDFEGFGIVYLEANLAGKPVIAGDSGGVRDAVEDGVNGLLVNPENIDEIAQAIIVLAKNQELRNRLSRQGKERAIQKFSWEKQIRIIYKILTNDP